MLLLLMTGCSWFEDKRTIVKPKVDITSPEYRKILSEIIDNRYDGEMFRNLIAEIEYRKYLKEENKR